MSDDRPNPITAPKGGMFDNIALRIKLILRLLADSRVNPLLKLIPIASVFYLLIPDLVIGPLDDAAVIWLGTFLFVELCPPDVVQEHMQALTKVVSGDWRDPLDTDGEIIDAEYWEED